MAESDDGWADATERWKARKQENPAVDAADLSDIDSGWVVLKNSDIVSADLAAAAVSGSQRLEETVGIVENAVEVVEHVAEVTEKLAANVAKQLPEDGSLQKAVEEVEHIAEVVDADAEKVEAVAEKVDKLSDQIDADVEPVIEELENELDQGTTSNNGANTQK
ncbi:hypothetical protein BAE44_0025868 [Dichanthelium oligosanthes]|uniref:Uncharacterized protein n=1 Tax=Dichanthelium oligosanthes TaxID=888268 RepID=A0A1E5UJP7_9POAL|nr:hypothetical protein BAE44_0025868 [Dichanthelium oligosanthes]